MRSLYEAWFSPGSAPRSGVLLHHVGAGDLRKPATSLARLRSTLRDSLPTGRLGATCQGAPRLRLA